MFCTECGRQLLADANFCIYCGKRASGTIFPTSKNELDKLEPVEAATKLIDTENNEFELEMVSHKDILSVIANRKCISTKLINTNKRDFTGNPRYENLDFVNKGDIVTLGYLDETETYLVLDALNNELGEINSSVSLEILKSRVSSIIAIVGEITENNQGKRAVSINVYI